MAYLGFKSLLSSTAHGNWKVQSMQCLYIGVKGRTKNNTEITSVVSGKSKPYSKTESNPCFPQTIVHFPVKMDVLQFGITWKGCVYSLPVEFMCCGYAV